MLACIFLAFGCQKNKKTCNIIKEHDNNKKIINWLVAAILLRMGL
jgi:hypothetical protein